MEASETVGTKHRVSRRRVVIGTAWTVPAISVASAAPAFAASPGVVTAVGSACKNSAGGNDKTYQFDIEFTNTYNCRTTVTVTEIVLEPNNGSPVTFPNDNLTFDVAAHSTVTKTFVSNVTQSAANGTLRVSYTYTDCQGNVLEFTNALDVGSLPPCA